MKLANGWYIINYHNIDWVDNDFLTSFRLTTSPNILEEHIKYLSSYAEIVSFRKGYEYFSNCNIKNPIISFSFDDGYKGLNKYATDILVNYNALGLVSICKSFFMMKELFWRNKLSYINLNEGNRFLRTRLKKYGFNLQNDRISKFTLDNFSLEIIKEIDEVFNKYEIDEKKIMRDLYLNSDELKEMINLGWEIGNHSLSHYPISEESYIHKFVEDFKENSDAIKKQLNYETCFLTLPFDRVLFRSEQINHLTKSNFRDKKIIYVGNNYNRNKKCNKIFRFASENESPKQLLKKLLT